MIPNIDLIEKYPYQRKNIGIHTMIDTSMT